MKKILFLFLVTLMLVSCDSPVQENDNEEQTVETTQETKVEETKEEPVEVIEEKKSQEETKEEQPEEPKEEPVEETPVEQPEETKVEEVTEEVEPKVEEQPEEITEEPEVKEQPVVTDTWIKVNTTEGDFGIPYFVVPKGYDPMNFERGWISEKFRNTNFIKFVKTNQTLTHKRKDKYKSSTWAFWKGDNTSRTFEAEVDVYEVYIYSNYTEDSAYITYNDLFYNDYDYFKEAFLIRKENDVWNIYSALTGNGTTYIPDHDSAKSTAKVISYYN